MNHTDYEIPVDDDAIVKNKEHPGLMYNVAWVHQQYNPTSAMILRTIGLTAIVVFVAWGLFYSGTGYYRSPFEQFVSNIGFRNKYEIELFAYIFGGAILLNGWFFRYKIGNLVSSVFFPMSGLFRRVFKSR